MWYLLLLAASHAIPFLGPPGPPEQAPGATRASVNIENANQHVKLSYLEWNEAASDAHPATGGSASPSISAAPPVILLHGSPGAGADFAKLAPLLASGQLAMPPRRRRLIAVDQLGFGDSTKWLSDYSIRSDARAVLQLMDDLHIDRAHIVGWSNGGGTALHMADMAPDRIVSMTLMASIGDQATEGSQSYFFEHAKYRVGLIATYAGELIPHFGLLGPFSLRHSAIRFFMDSDQRALDPIMRRTAVPTLILHGRHDFLVPAWAAERHHDMMPASRLVMLDASHFLPFLQAEESAAWLEKFFTEHDRSTADASASATDTLPPITNLAPVPPPRDIQHATRPIGHWLTTVPWTVETGLLVLISLLSPALGALTGAVFVRDLWLNFSVLVVAMIAARLARMYGGALVARLFGDRIYQWPIVGKRLSRVSITDWQRRWATKPVRTGWLAALFPPLRREAGFAVGLAPKTRAPIAFFIGHFLGSMVWGFIASLAAVLVLVLLLTPARNWLGWFGVLLTLALAASAARHAPTLLTRLGRQRLRAHNARIYRREYWPAFLYYLPLAPYLIYLGLKHRGLTLPTCVNPGIEAGGGMVGESKHSIMRALGSGRAGAPASVLATVMIGEDGDLQRRADRVIDAMQREPSLASFPIIIKPDSGQRGFGVRVMRSREDIVEYFTSMTRPAIVQPYHPGPYECGVLWVRCAATLNGHAAPSTGHDNRITEVKNPSLAANRTGFVYSITGKEFPELVGDGHRTLEELIYAHRRFRRQADIFLDRFAAERSSIPVAGERIRLALSGNHCQGTLFRDGGELMTPELEAAFDALASSFNRVGDNGSATERGGGLDFGRFDVRFTSPEEFKRGSGFGVLELNGATGESTNLYDPERSLWWSYRVLFGQWRHLYELGALRRDAGARPMTWGEVVRSIRAHYRDRRGSTLAD